MKQFQLQLNLSILLTDVQPDTKTSKTCNICVDTNKLILALRRLGVPSQQNIANHRVIALPNPWNSKETNCASNLAGAVVSKTFINR